MEADLNTNLNTIVCFAGVNMESKGQQGGHLQGANTVQINGGMSD